LNNILELECDLENLRKLADKIAKQTKIGDIFLLKGDLGAGKTTFSRMFINALFEKEKINKPDKIKSPTFPIMISYPILNHNIYHYDLYRLKNKNELTEIGLFENLENNIIIIEWPELLTNNYNLEKNYLINFSIINSSKRSVKIYHALKKNM
jgi:tRNA threonylcarbamoyladenosine biosynthesis protein TsaE|tara:strand:+ start:217 stop:675 length:459 start_codon:yes stop_codon:yes gene_type:complete